jgi:hypothetical protein
MKKVLFGIACVFFIVCFDISADDVDAEKMYKNAIAVGFLHGGGALVGVDYERLIVGPLGIQVGGGFRGFGAGINFHFEPTVKSSGISLAFWNQGWGEYFTQRIIGVCYVYRGKRWFTAQIGVGYVLARGAAFSSIFDELGIPPVPVLLMYSAGGYFSF